MGIFSKLFGYRWSLFFVRNGTQKIYVLNENSVAVILGYVMLRFADGGRPVEPWSLQLTCNSNKRVIKLSNEHFTPDGESVTSKLMKEIETIDSGYRVNGGEPVFEEVSSGKKIPMSAYKSGPINLSEMVESMNKPKGVTFYSVLDECFGS